jgi:ribosomal protein S15P/S13E
MSVNKFGRSSQSNNVRDLRSQFAYFSAVAGGSVILHRTTDGNIDINNVKLCNIKDPTLNTDAAHKKYVDNKIKDAQKYSAEALKVLNSKMDFNSESINKQIKDVIERVRSEANTNLEKQTLNIRESFEVHTRKNMQDISKQMDDINASINYVKHDVQAATKRINEVEEHIEDVCQNKIQTIKTQINDDWKREFEKFSTHINAVLVDKHVD